MRQEWRGWIGGPTRVGQNTTRAYDPTTLIAGTPGYRNTVEALHGY